MAIVDLVMPKLGESIMEATVLKWHKQPGDKVAMDETVLDIATDKVDSEVPSTAAGVIEEIFFNVNDVVPIGTVIAKIRTGAAEPVGAAPAPEQPTQRKTESIERAEEAVVVETIQRPTQNYQHTAQNGSSNGNRFYSP